MDIDKTRVEKSRWIDKTRVVKKIFVHYPGI